MYGQISSFALHLFAAVTLARRVLSAPTSNIELLSAQGSLAVPIPKSIASLSIEFCYITDYLGDVNSPNKLSLRLLQNIQDLTGEPPRIRIGGHTQDVAQYCDTCTNTLTNIFQPGNLEAVNVTFNEKLFTILNDNVPSNQQFILGLNLGQNNVAYPLAEVEAAEKYLHSSRRLSYELGNEPDFYGPSQRSPWNVQIYAAQIISWVKQIKTSTNTKTGWWIGSLAQLPIYQNNFSLPELGVLGVPEAIKTSNGYSDHTYPYSVCDPTRAAMVSLSGLMNHTTTLSYFTQWSPSIAAARQANVPFYMGETGSVSCHGAPGISNTLGAALWEMDYVLNGAVLGMSGVYFHMGTPFYYSMWQPVAYGSVPAKVYPTYYTLLTLATAFSTLPDPYIVQLKSPSNSPNLAAYALYASNNIMSSTPPAKLILLNMNYYSANATTERPVQKVDVSQLLGPSFVRVMRLTAKGADSTSGATFAGQDWEMDGVAQGKKVHEVMDSRQVTVGDSEGVIVEAI